MNAAQRELYEEWRAVEAKLRAVVIDFSDSQKANELRPRVWKELGKFLSVGEKFELGSDLGKPLKEIFDQKYPPDSWPVARRWGTRAIYRANGGFIFLRECLEHIHRGSTDPLYSRPVYILLSTYSELLFSAYFLLLKDELLQKTSKELESLLRGGRNHDLKDLADLIGHEDLLRLGIIEVRSESRNELKRYIITLTNKDKIIVEDSVEVRYDFKYDRIRDIDLDESGRMKKEIEHLLVMTKEVLKLVPTDL